MANDIICAAAGSLVIFENARREIAEAATVEQVKCILAQATGLAAAARAATDREMEAEAAVLKLEAERKLGQLMAAQKATVGFNKGGGDQRSDHRDSENPGGPPTLTEAGIDKNLAKKARAAASMSEPEFEAAKESKRAAVLTQAQAKSASPANTRTTDTAPIKAAIDAEPEVKPAVVTVPAKTTESILIRIADLARDCRGLLAHPEQNADEIRKKLSQIIKLSDPNSKGRSDKSAASNAKLDPKLFRRAMALETEAVGDTSTLPAGNDVDTEASADERRGFYAAADDEASTDPDNGIPAFLQRH